MEYHVIKKEIEAGKFAVGYLFHGEESYPVESLIDLIIRTGVDEQTRDFNCDILQAQDVDAEKLVTLASSYPMMSERRLVIVKDIDRYAKEGLERILKYLVSPLESTCLVMTAGKLDMRKKALASMASLCHVYESKPLYENQALDWVIQALKSRERTISHEAAAFLVQNSGTSLHGLKQEIEKLITFAWDEKQITLKTVTSLTGMSRNYNLWEYSDAIARKDLKNAYAILFHLMENKQSPVGLIINLTTRLIQLYRIRLLREKGYTQQKLAQTLKLRPYFVKLFMEQAERFSSRELTANIRSLLLADHAIKSGYLDGIHVMTLLTRDLICGQRSVRFFQ